MYKHSSLLALIALLAILPSVQAQEASSPTLEAVIEARSEEDRARDPARHPRETLEFFQIEPGMTVAEALPGAGWYTNILANYLGSEGTLFGVNYQDRVWPMFSYATEEMVKKRIAMTRQFPKMVKDFTDNDISASGFTFNTVPTEATGAVDRVLLIRALHNLNRFEATSGTRSQAMAAIRAMLKADGMVGIVQHRASEDSDDALADGSRGYLKQSAVIEIFEQAGFALVATSEINANPKDQPGPEDIVWRLPPSLNGSEDNPELQEAMLAIGESDRMTLLFRKLD